MNGADLVVTGVGTALRPPGGSDDWFDVTARLGRRGYKYLPAGAHYLLAAVKDAVGGAVDAVAPERRGLAVGCHGVLAAYYAAADRTVVDGSAEDLSPVTAPFFAINALAGRTAGEHAVKGFTLTTTSPRISGLQAWETGARAAAAGRCDVLVVAVTEHGAGDGDGAVAVVLESRDRAAARGATVHGECRVRTGFLPPDADPGEAAAYVRDLVGRVGAGDAVPVRLIADDAPAGRLVAAALQDRAGPLSHPSAASGGCVTPVRAVSEALGRSGHTLIVTASSTGHIAAALARSGADRKGETAS
jgi:3-oxoacyl-[acyl-carrier-protein] synthase II